MELASITQLRTQRAVAAEQKILAQDVLLDATLTVPLGARGVVLLPHASSAGRFERSHCFTAEVLSQAGLGTLQIDLLTPAEEASSNGNPGQAEVALLAERILAAITWLENQPDTSRLALGLFAARVETVAAMVAAERSGRVVALASKGGCPDFASESVAHLTGPTLLLLGPEELARAEELAAEFFGRHFS
jgi:putative phosphoribosyl transferase